MSAKKELAPPPPVLDPEQAGVLLKANYRNLAKKVQAGKTLSASEINLLESLKGGTEAEKKTHAADQAELARILGVNRKTIQRAIKSGDSRAGKQTALTRSQLGVGTCCARHPRRQGREP